jgi:hypothetical protein
MEPPPGGITNAECSSVMFYVAKKAELQHEPNKNNVSQHPKINLLRRVLACIRNPEQRLFRAYQEQEHKDRSRTLGQVTGC